VILPFVTCLWPCLTFTTQSPRVTAGDFRGRGNLPDHGVLSGHRISIRAFMILRTSLAFKQIDAGVELCSTRHLID